MQKKKLPIGIENFEKLRSEDFYYVDKTGLIRELLAKFYFLLDSEKLNEHDKAEYKELLDKNMNESMFSNSLKLLSGMLEKHYGTKVILLIDEYDVPLAKVHGNGYYDPMVSLIRNFLGQALKTNSSLKFAVMTGDRRRLR